VKTSNLTWGGEDRIRREKLFKINRLKAGHDELRRR
jgi:hypothetical protein